MSYIPDQGDIVLLEFDPQAGHEQRGKRPALVVSNHTFNTFTKMAMVCPITNTKRNFPLHIKLNSDTKTSGYILCEQVKSLDIVARKCLFLEKLSEEMTEEVIALIKDFL